MGFHLVRYFTLASLLAFVVVTTGLGMAQRTIAIDNLSSQQEGANVNLAITFANALWDDFKPFVEKAGSLSLEELRAAPEQAKLRELTLALMKNPSVLKVKVFDLNGLTVFSTEAAQIGDDKTNNAGYLSARAGKVASELTHRDTFSAFEQTIEDRDVISSYIPLNNPQSGAFEGVFEIYSDVTPFLKKIQDTSLLVVGVVVGALALLYFILFLIVKRADNIIKAQEKKNSQAQLQVAQSEKMASLGQMVAGVAHELNTPLAFTRSSPPSHSPRKTSRRSGSTTGARSRAAARGAAVSAVRRRLVT